MAKRYKIIAADFLQCEPRIFAHFSGEKRLQSVFDSDDDFYSVIAIDVMGLSQYSASPKDGNFLKKLAPDTRQTSKVFCFTDSTMIEVQGKGLISIKDARVGNFVKTHSGYKKITHLFNREAKIKRVVTNKAMFKATEDHPFWVTGKEWVDVKDLKPNDLLEYQTTPIPDTTKYPSAPVYSNASFKNGASKPLSYVTIDEDWAWIIGAFLGDGVGSYTRRQNTQCKNRAHNSHLISGYIGICGLKSDGVIQKFNDKMKQLGYVGGYKSRNEGKTNELCQYSYSDFELVKIFENSFNLIGERTEGGLVGRKNLRIPPCIFNAPYSVRLATLAGLFDTDGYLKGSPNKISSEVNICSKSQDLISDIGNLLSTMDLEYTVSEEWNKDYNKYYFMLRLRQSAIYKLAEMDIQRFMTVKRKLQAFNKRLEIPPKAPTLPCRVRKVIDTDEVAQVYDITVEEVHEFIANGIRVHNCLAVPYGAEAFQIAAQLGYLKGGRVDIDKGQKLINQYLGAYPNLHKYMKRQELMAKRDGYVTNLFGRVRQIPDAKRLYDQYGDALLDSRWAKQRGLEMERKDYKSALNVAKNSPIQSTAADVINMAMIELAGYFKDNGLDASIRLQTHDELAVIAEESICDLVAEKLEYYMCNNRYALQLDVKLEAEAKIGNTLKEVK